MQSRRDYARLFHTLSPEALATIQAQLRLPPLFTSAPYTILTARGFCAADAVVVLASRPEAWAAQAIETILGRPITVLAARVAAPYAPCLSRLPEADDRRIQPTTAANPRLPTTDSYHRFAMLRAGLSIRSYISRVGVERGRRDLREWQRLGEIELSQVPPPLTAATVLAQHRAYA